MKKMIGQNTEMASDGLWVRNMDVSERGPKETSGIQNKDMAKNEKYQLGGWKR